MKAQDVLDLTDHMTVIDLNALDASDSLRAKTAVLVGALGSKSELAEYLGVARSQPGRWISGAERPSEHARRMIKDFEYVWDRLTDDRDSEAAHIWLNSPNAYLDGTSPLGWLRARGPAQVVEAMDAEEAGSYA